MKSLLSFVVAALVLPASLCAEVIRVNSQAAFDAIASSVSAAVASGAAQVTVEMSPGTYYFSENHLKLARKQWSGVSIAIRGNGATLVSEGKDFAAGQKFAAVFNTNHGFVSLTGGLVPLWGDLMQADELVEVVNESAKLCRLSCADIDQDVPADRCGNVYINLTQWYRSNTYRVKYIKDSYVYFTATDLTYNKARKCHSVNLDYGFGKMMPRFRLCNMPQTDEPLMSLSGGTVALPKGVSRVHQCTATRFLHLDHTALAALSIDSLTFLGNSNSNAALLQLTNSTIGAFNLSRCTFSAIQSNVVKADTTDNVSVTRCTFRDCFRHGVYTVNSANATITGNTFVRMGLACNNTFSIRSSGKNISIADNTIEDYGYGGIAVGTWWASPKRMDNTGVVERNLLRYTDDYMDQWLSHSLMDSGAIYVYTQCDDIQIRHNFINNYNGAYYNRGIFCDDGTLNVTISSNIITNITNSYAIDLRRSVSIEKAANSHTPTVNVNNRISGNIISAPIRFEGRDANANCRLGTNLLLGKAAELKSECVTSNLQSEAAYLNIRQWSADKDCLTLPANQSATLRRLPGYKALSQRINIGETTRKN